MLHAYFVRSPHARAAIRAIDASAALALAGVHAVFTAADLNPGVKEQWHTSIGPQSPETPRPPLAEDEVRFVGDPVALVVAASRALAEDAAELVDVDYDPLPAVVDYTEAEHAAALVHEQHGSNVIGEINGLPVGARRRVRGGRARDHRDDLSTGVCRRRWRARPDRRLRARHRRPHDLRRRRRPTRCACSAPRLLGMPEHRIRVVMRDTGGGFGQKVMVQRDEMCLMLAAPKVGAPVKWVEDRRENLLAAGKSRHEHGTVRWRSTPTARSRPRTSTSSPTAAPTPRRGRSVRPPPSGCCSPGRTACRARLRDQVDLHEHRRAHGVPRPWQFETLARGAARHRGAPDGHRPHRAAPAQSVAPRRAPVRIPTACRTTTSRRRRRSSRRSRCSTTTRSARSRPRRARPVATWVWACRTTSSRRRPASATTRPRPRRSASSPRARSTCTSRAARAGNSIETTVVQLTADALGANIDDVNTIQGDTALTGFGAGARAAGAGR